MLSPLRFYEIYTAVNLHFNSNTNYDFIKYCGKTRKIQEKTFAAKKGRYFFEKFSSKFHKEQDAIMFCVANIFYGETWIASYDYKHYLKFTSYRDSICYRFEQDLLKYSGSTKQEDPVEDCIFAGKNDSFIYLIILNIVTDGKIFELYDRKFEKQGKDFIWCEYRQQLKLFQSFIEAYWFDENGEIKNAILRIISKNKA